MPRRRYPKPGSLPVISLFSGCGGLDVAVERSAEPAGVQDGTPGPLAISVATDYEPVALATLAANMPHTPTLTGDIRDLGGSDLMAKAGLAPGDAALVVGGPPCTPFSKSGFHIEAKRTSTDPNASLLDDYVRIVAETRPAAFILENVQGLTYRTHEAQFRRLLAGLDALGYNPQWRVLIAAEHGVPQLRRRLFVIGARDGRRLLFPPPSHSGWSERDFHGDPRLPAFRTTGDLLGPLLGGTPEKGEIVDGTYGDLAAEVPAGYNYLWHTERGGGRPVFRWRSRYWTFLLRLDPQRPATTIQAQPGPWVGPFHWENVDTPNGPRARRLRVRESLAIQTFPEGFTVADAPRAKDRAMLQRQIGNAVPVELGKAVVRSVAAQMGWLPPPPEPVFAFTEREADERVARERALALRYERQLTLL